MNTPIRQAMILAAGKGTRMLPVTQNIPKPLVKLKGKALIVHQIEHLIKAGVTHIIINVMHHKEQIIQEIGNGDKYKINIQYSEEDALLGTGGGIVKALPYFKQEKFIVASADVYTDFNFAKFTRIHKPDSALAHIVLAPNPFFKPDGDFKLENGLIIPALGPSNSNSFTYASMGWYHPDFFIDAPAGEFCLGAFLQSKAGKGKISGEIYTGMWHNIGTIEQLQYLEGVI